MKNDAGVIYYPYKPDLENYMFPRTHPELDKCEQGLPIPPQGYWLYGKDIADYLNDGKYDTERMLDIVGSSDFSLKKGDRVLDFGCASGRMIRWLKPFTETCEIWGVDIYSELIYWANRYLKPPFNFAVTTTLPHLPFEDKYFNLIYCYSVFTHIDDLTESWLLELRRILAEDGRLFLTIHDFNTIKELDSNPFYKDLWLKKVMDENKLYNNNKYNFSLLVNGRGPASQVFYDVQYFCDSIKTFFEILSINENAYGHQTGILLKRKR